MSVNQLLSIGLHVIPSDNDALKIERDCDVKSQRKSQNHGHPYDHLGSMPLDLRLILLFISENLQSLYPTTNNHTE